MMTNGLNSGWTSPFLPELENDPNMELTKDGGSWIAAAFPIGGAIGAIIAGSMMDVIGRKKPMVLSENMSIVGWLIIATVRSRYVLFLGRLIAGVGNGIICTVLPVYLMEVCDTKIGRPTVFLANTSLFMGALVINIAGYCLSLTFASLLCTLLPLVCLTMCWWLPESPKYYLIKENANKAKKVMRQITDKENVDEEIEQIVHRHFPLSRLFTDKCHRSSILTCIGIIVVQQCSGIVPIMFYSQRIFGEAVGDIPPIASVVIFYTTLMIISIVPLITVGGDKRPLLKQSVIGVGLSLLMEGINLYVEQKHLSAAGGYPWITMVIILFYIISYCLGLLAVPISMIESLFPREAVTMAVCVCVAFSNTASSILVKVFQFSYDNHSLYVSFFICANCSFLSLVFVTCFISNNRNTTAQPDMELSENVAAPS